MSRFFLLPRPPPLSPLAAPSSSHSLSVLSSGFNIFSFYLFCYRRHFVLSSFPIGWFFICLSGLSDRLDHQIDHNLALHTKELPMYALLGALRRQFEGDTPILKLVNEIIDVQCQLCGSLFSNQVEKQVSERE